MRITHITTTERHTFDYDLAHEEHQALLDDGFVYDRLSRQYRKSRTVTKTEGEPFAEKKKAA